MHWTTPEYPFKLSEIPLNFGNTSEAPTTVPEAPEMSLKTPGILWNLPEYSSKLLKNPWNHPGIQKSFSKLAENLWILGVSSRNYI